MRRPLSFFLVVFAMAIALTLVPNSRVRSAVAPLFIAVYVVYLVIVIRFEEQYREADIGPLTLGSLVARVRRQAAAADPSAWGATLQTLLALALILIGAQIFVGQIIDLSASLGINATALDSSSHRLLRSFLKNLTASSGCDKERIRSH